MHSKAASAIGTSTYHMGTKQIEMGNGEDNMYRAHAFQSYCWKQILRSLLVRAWLLGLLSLFECFQGSQIKEDNSVTSYAKRRPIDVDTSTAEGIGQEALEKIGYDEIIKLSEKAGFVEYKSNLNIQLISYESVVATDFVPVFSRYAVAAAVTTQADSPLPGPADLAALGVVAIGLVDAGLLDGYLLNTVGGWLVGTRGTTADSAGTANAIRAEAGPAAEGAPKPSPNFELPTNPPQHPPTSVPAGHSVRVMPPTEQYPNGYWVQTNQHGQPINPATGKPPANVTRPQARAQTHVPLPPTTK
jgi:hypothetical protein